MYIKKFFKIQFHPLSILFWVSSSSSSVNPHSVAISAGSSWVDGLQELLRVPWHLFRCVKERTAGCLVQPFIKSCQSLSPSVDVLCPVPRMEYGWARTRLSTPDLASSCSTAWLCWNTIGNRSLGVLTPDLWVPQGNVSHAQGLKGKEMLTGSCTAESEAGPASQHALDRVNFTAV